MAVQSLGLVDYVKLGVVVLAAAAMYAVQSVLLAFYYCFPFKGALDFVFGRVKQLRDNFSLHLGVDESPGQSKYTMDTPQLVAHLGYRCEEHLVETTDGFILVLHRVLPREPEGPDAPPRVPVLVQHGLMQDSEAWLTTGPRSLPAVLVDSGFDVFLGNNRGNKYSCKHRRLSPGDPAYWSFSLDDMAAHDVPAAVHYITAVTGQPRLAYVGFSQGTAQMFAALVADPTLSEKVCAFGALAAAVGVRGLAKSALSSLVEADENFLYLLFGRGVMLSMSDAWRRMLSPQRFMWMIGQSVSFLFGWDMTRNMTYADRMTSFAHIYSFCSVKAVVHWFQIIRSRRFQVFADAGTLGTPPRYDVSTVTVPTAVFMGGQDTVVDAVRTVKLLPPAAYVFFEPTYSHLDFKWAAGVAAPGRAFESLVAFLHAHAPGAAAASDRQALTDRFGSPQPHLKVTPAALRGALSQYAGELASHGLVVPAPAPRPSGRRSAPSTPRGMRQSQSLADVGAFVSDFVETFGSTPMALPPPGEASSGSDSEGVGGVRRRVGSSASEAEVDALDRAVGGYVSDVLGVAQQWTHPE